MPFDAISNIDKISVLRNIDDCGHLCGQWNLLLLGNYWEINLKYLCNCLIMYWFLFLMHYIKIQHCIDFLYQLDKNFLDKVFLLKEMLMNVYLIFLEINKIHWPSN